MYRHDMNHLQVFGLFFLSGGLLAVFGGLERMNRRRALIRRAVAVTARVVEVVAEGGSEDGDPIYHFPVVTFTVEEKTVRAKLLRGILKSGEVRTGGSLRVYYDPLDPVQVVTRPRDFPGGAAATALGAVLAAVGAGLCWVGRNGV